MNKSLDLTDIIKSIDIDELAEFLGYVPMQKVFIYVMEDMDRFKEFSQLVIKDNCGDFRLYEDYLYADGIEKDSFLSSKQYVELYEMFYFDLLDNAIDPIYDMFYDVRTTKKINDNLIQEYMDDYFKGKLKDVEQKIIERVKENLAEESEQIKEDLAY